jgi:nucleoside-diphosphate-sugar epimerase
VRILITGSLGYVAPGLIRQLRDTFASAELVGVDTGWFSAGLVGDGRAPETLLDRQVFLDVRDMSASHLVGVDYVIHLAAISNDPMGDRFADLTEDVNFRQSVRLAGLAREAGARGFVFASSASVYGAGADAPRTETSEVAPLTAYARSKISTERALLPLADDDFTVTCLRFATACGWSSRIRLDLVLNDFVASALTTGRIEVLSDGSPWRPLIHVRDMARALTWAVTEQRATASAGLVANVGRSDWNYQVKDLAAAVSSVMGGVEVSINADAPADKRSYQVDFSEWRRLAPDAQPQEDLEPTIAELAERLKGVPQLDAEFRTSRYIRLSVLNSLRASGELGSDLRWTGLSS